MSLDDELRVALKPVDPGPEFTARVLAAVETEQQRSAGVSPGPATSPSGGRRVARPWRPWLWPALAASLVGALVGARWAEERREAERGEQARVQVMQALRLTSSKLNTARAVIDRH